MDMTQAIIPKSDQWNADDFLSGPMTFQIKGVKVKPSEEQPVSIEVADSHKAYRPCKSMARVLVSAWGADSSKYVGRSLTLYCDPKVKWAGMEVGGIRISHMSDISEPLTLALTATRGNKKPFTVRPIEKPKPRAPLTAEQKIAKAAATFGELGVDIDTLATHLGKPIPEATKAELEAAYAHFDAIKPAGQGLGARPV